MSKIHLHAALQRFTQCEAIEIPGTFTLNILLEHLVEKFPKLKTILFTNSNRISPYIVIFVDGEDSRHLDAQYSIADDAVVELVTSLVGG
jgi:hypothetical protein